MASISNAIPDDFVRIELEGKDRLGFIDGSCVKPNEGSAELKQWRITDSLVRTWIFKTMTKDIVNVFLYASSARTLWVELEARYVECDGPCCTRSNGRLAQKLKVISVSPLIIQI
ncbi:UNVERIFIED_CONTAM: hypothetical protein Slati_2762000 [Sesamum latifolium]|uniref:Uncharacterized protein n=1 Tax=Sesamum latifolium TaxID=2727402 RepID=A0AAW2VXI8_9LAMI